MADFGQFNLRGSILKCDWRKAIVAFVAAFCVGGLAQPLVAQEPDASASPRQLYNDGTEKLRAGKFQEAEACLQGAVASQDMRVQPPALYNLGETRFSEGAEDLEKGPQHDSVSIKARQASDAAGSAIQSTGDALAGDEVNGLISAYIEGRGARKTLRGAIQAVKAALDNYAAVLTKWQRASGDFKSAHELLPADGAAKTNAALVDRYIAALIDQQRLLMQTMKMLGDKREKLSKNMAKLKERMPPSEANKLPGQGEEDEDADEPGGGKPPELKDGQHESGPKNGKEMGLTQEEASRLLDMLKLDANRTLPLGMEQTGKPSERKGRDW